MLRRGEITDSMSVIAILDEAVRRLEQTGPESSEAFRRPLPPGEGAR